MSVWYQSHCWLGHMGRCAGGVLGGGLEGYWQMACSAGTIYCFFFFVNTKQLTTDMELHMCKICTVEPFNNNDIGLK